MSPLDRLRDAVEAFLLDTGHDEASLDGFVLLAQTSIIDPDIDATRSIPRSVGEHYATDLPLPAATGLAAGFEQLGRRMIAGSMTANGDI